MNSALPEDYFSLQIAFNKRKTIANISVLYVSDNGILNVRKALSQLFEIEMLTAEDKEIENGFYLLEFNTKSIEKIEIFIDILKNKLDLYNLISQISPNQ